MQQQRGAAAAGGGLTVGTLGARARARGAGAVDAGAVHEAKIAVALCARAVVRARCAAVGSAGDAPARLICAESSSGGEVR